MWIQILLSRPFLIGLQWQVTQKLRFPKSPRSKVAALGRQGVDEVSQFGIEFALVGQSGGHFRADSVTQVESELGVALPADYPLLQTSFFQRALPRLCQVRVRFFQIRDQHPHPCRPGLGLGHRFQQIGQCFGI